MTKWFRPDGTPFVASGGLMTPRDPATGGYIVKDRLGRTRQFRKAAEALTPGPPVLSTPTLRRG